MNVRVDVQERMADGHWVTKSSDVHGETALRPELAALVKDWDWVAFGYDDPKIPVRRIVRKVTP